MRKILICLVTVLSLVFVFGLHNTASASVSANVPVTGGGSADPYKYYGNGLYCNQLGCKVDWSRTWYCGVNNAAGWLCNWWESGYWKLLTVKKDDVLLLLKSFKYSLEADGFSNSDLNFIDIASEKIKNNYTIRTEVNVVYQKLFYVKFN